MFKKLIGIISGLAICSSVAFGQLAVGTVDTAGDPLLVTGQAGSWTNLAQYFNDAGFITNGLQSGDNISELVNDSGYYSSGDTPTFLGINSGNQDFIINAQEWNVVITNAFDFLAKMDGNVKLEPTSDIELTPGGSIKVNGNLIQDVGTPNIIGFGYADINYLTNSTPVEVHTTATGGLHIVNFQTMDSQGYLTSAPNIEAVLTAGSDASGQDLIGVATFEASDSQASKVTLLNTAGTKPVLEAAAGATEVYLDGKSGSDLYIRNWTAIFLDDDISQTSGSIEPNTLHLYDNKKLLFGDGGGSPGDAEMYWNASHLKIVDQQGGTGNCDFEGFQYVTVDNGVKLVDGRLLIDVDGANDVLFSKIGTGADIVVDGFGHMVVKDPLVADRFEVTAVAGDPDSIAMNILYDGTNILFDAAFDTSLFNGILATAHSATSGQQVVNYTVMTNYIAQNPPSVSDPLVISVLTNSSPVEVHTTAVAGKDIVNWETMVAQGYYASGADPTFGTITAADLVTSGTLTLSGDTAIELNSSGGTIRPGTDILPSSNNSYTSGGSSFRWATVYSVNGNYSGAITVPYLTNSSPVEVHTTATAGKDIVNYETMDAQGYYVTGAASIIPTSGNTYDLGSAPDNFWRNLYVQNANANTGVFYTVTAAGDDLVLDEVGYLTNNNPVEVHTTATAGKDIVNYETMAAYVPEIREGTHSAAGASKTATFSSVMGSAPTVVATFGEDIGELAQVSVTASTTSNFTYQIRNGAGTVTNAWTINYVAAIE